MGSNPAAPTIYFQTLSYFANQGPITLGTPFSEFYHQRALHWFRIYLCVGGMPAAVAAFLAHKGNEPEGARAAREIQKGLIAGYAGDFSKHSGTLNANHILRVFESCATQLGRAQDESVSKFKFGGVIPKRKGFEAIDGPLTWLEKSRLAIKTYMADRFEQPITAFTLANYFKAYLLDVGLLNSMLNVPIEALLLDALGTYKGYLAENFVAQELFAALDHELCGWAESQSEVEFLVSRGADLCPMEVKASSRSRRAKSLDALIMKYHPALSIKVTGQNRGFVAGKNILTLPIYLVGQVPEKREPPFYAQGQNGAEGSF